MRARRGWLVCVLLLASPQAARADAIAADQHFQEAMKHYQAGEFTRASREFSRAYRLEKKPKYLFGWAQAERQRGRCGVAKVLYEEFLTLNPTPQDVVAARSAMKRCETDPGADTWAVAEPMPETVSGIDETPRAQAEPEREPEKRERPNIGLTAKKRERRSTRVSWVIGSRVDLDPIHRGAVLAPCLGVGFGLLELFGNALLGGNQGLETGARLAGGKKLAPFLSVSVPVFFIEGARVGVRGAVGGRYRLGNGWALTVEAGGSMLTDPPPGLSRGVGLVSLGVEVWN
jgi:hypothetical protein